MDATFWATVGLVLFLALIAYLKVPGMVGRSLDQRAAKIKAELEEARRLREEAQQLLAEYQRKRKEAEKEASEIVEHARREAEQFVAEAKQKSEDYVVRRNALAEQKIAQAERDAVNEVRARAVDLAVESARSVLAAKVDAKADAALFADSLDQLRTRLN